MPNPRADFFALSLPQLRACLQAWGEPAYRAAQVLEAAWRDGADDFADTVFLPGALRRKLDESFVLSPAPQPASVATSSDHTQKFLFRFPDGNSVESVTIPQTDRLTFCLSTQIGCALGCRFCATARLGLKRSLTMAEILGQIRGLMRQVKRRPTHLVFMGMGEPLQNLAALRPALDIICHPRALGLPGKKITVSTSGWLPGLEELISEPLPGNLAFSLNAVQESKRSWLMPVNRQYPLGKVLPALKQYARASGRAVTLEYILLRDFNDSLEDARVLARVAGNALCKVNLIPWNPVPGISLQAPDGNQVRVFVRELQNQRVTVTCRKARGACIGAACGQLAGRDVPKRRAA